MMGVLAPVSWGEDPSTLFRMLAGIGIMPEALVGLGERMASAGTARAFLLGLWVLPEAAGMRLPLTSDRSRVLILSAIAFSAFVIFGAGVARGSSGKSAATGGGSGRSRAAVEKESELSTESRWARKRSIGIFDLIFEPLTLRRHFMLHCPHRKTVSSYSS